jgi:hypothetical protein
LHFKFDSTRKYDNSCGTECITNFKLQLVSVIYHPGPAKTQKSKRPQIEIELSLFPEMFGFFESGIPDQ